MSDHQITTVDPDDRRRLAWRATCVCGWTDPEAHPTSGKATLAAWAHVHTSPPEIMQTVAPCEPESVARMVP